MCFPKIALLVTPSGRKALRISFSSADHYCLVRSSESGTLSRREILYHTTTNLVPSHQHQQVREIEQVSICLVHERRIPSHCCLNLCQTDPVRITYAPTSWHRLLLNDNSSVKLLCVLSLIKYTSIATDQKIAECTPDDTGISLYHG